MKKSTLLLLCALFTLHCSLAQQYGWKNISANLPEFYHDTVLINNGADTLIANLSGISFIDDNHGWICTYHPFDGDPSALLETTDGGETWVEHSAPLAGKDIYMINAENGYFGAYNGMIYKTADGGETWAYHGHLTVALYDLEFPPRPAQNGYAGGKDGHLSRITPEGVFPFSLGLNGSVYSISFPTEEEGWALLDYQLIIRYLDSAWISDASHPFSSKSSLFCLDNHLGWCVGDRFLLTTNGQDWIQVDPGFVQTGAMMGVFFTDPDNGWAVGAQGQIAYSINGGNDWTMLAHNLTDAMLTGILFTSATNGYIIGGNKTLLKYSRIDGVEEREKESIAVRPNPTTGQFKVYPPASGSKFNIERVELVDLFGKVAAFYNWDPASDEMELNANNLPDGIYLLRIISEKHFASQKIIIQK